MTTRKPHNQDAGYICEKIYKPSGSHIVIYKAAEQGIDADHKYAVVCSKHGSILSTTSIPLAREDMKYPEFCEGCMQEADPIQNQTDRIKEGSK